MLDSKIVVIVCKGSSLTSSTCCSSNGARSSQASVYIGPDTGADNGTQSCTRDEYLVFSQKISIYIVVLKFE